MKPVNQRIISLLIMALVLVLQVQPALADAAPPQPPPGNSILPGEILTMVQMVSEEVIIEVGTEMGEITSEYDYVISGLQAKVTATFNMRNQGVQEERLSVRFPLSAHDGWGMVNEVSEFTVRVGNQSLDWARVPYGGYPILYWAAFGVTFPPEKDVVITVSYEMISGSSDTEPGTNFVYILETGSGWYGPIGEGDIILRLPYQANSTNVILESSTDGGIFRGKEVLWHFEDLEPTDNWDVKIQWPHIWLTVIDAQETLEKDPKDVDALRALGEAALEATLDRKVGVVTFQELADLFLTGEDALQRATMLAPDDPGLRLKYAEALIAHRLTNYYQFNLEERTPTFEEILFQLNVAESLDPGNTDTQGLYDELLFLAEAADYELPPLGSPTAIPTNLPTRTFAATNTRSLVTSTPRVSAAPSIVAPSPIPAPSAIPLIELDDGETSPPINTYLWIAGLVIVILLRFAKVRSQERQRWKKQ